jgi:Iap family predicted aminopeptidase
MTDKWTVCGLLLALCTVPAKGQAPAKGRPYLEPRERQRVERLQRAISTKEMQQLLEKFNHLDRISGGRGEAEAARLLTEALERHGVPHKVHRFRAYLSWPIRAELVVTSPERRTLRAVTAAFSASTGARGLEGELVFVGSPGAIFGPLASESYPGKDVRGKIVVADGLITPQNARLMEDLGAMGLVHINPRELLHEMIMTTVWGTPTPETAASVPKMPALSVAKADGEWLKQAAQRGGVRVRLVTEVSTAWREIPLVVAEVRPGIAAKDAMGADPEQFILVSAHLDAWYAGMTDTASSNISILEMARILHANRTRLRRGFRFAWWPGHSTGRYAGSTWYADQFWSELDRNCIAYMNLDGPGARNVPLDRVATWAWPELGEFTRNFAREWSGKEPEEGYFAGAMRVFRPFRAGDSAFQGIGVPEVSIGLPEIPAGHPDHAPYVGGSERGWWWHTAEDTLDKIDMKALVRDAELRLAELFVLANEPVLPYRLAPIAQSYVTVLNELAAEVKSHADLWQLVERAERLERRARDLDRWSAESAGRAGRGAKRFDQVRDLNRLLLKLSHSLNATLYTESGRFDQDAATPLAILPGLNRARQLAKLDPASDEYGFLLTRVIRERNRVVATLDAALERIELFLRAAVRTK